MSSVLLSRLVQIDSIINFVKTSAHGFYYFGLLRVYKGILF